MEYSIRELPALSCQRRPNKPTISAPKGEPPILKAPPGHGPRRGVRGRAPTAGRQQKLLSAHSVPSVVRIFFIPWQRCIVRVGDGEHFALLRRKRHGFGNTARLLGALVPESCIVEVRHSPVPLPPRHCRGPHGAPLRTTNSRLIGLVPPDSRRRHGGKFDSHGQRPPRRDW
jgi:hypothetical protein